MKGYTAIEGPLANEVAAGLVHALQRVQGKRCRVFQKFYDLFSDKGIFEKKVIVRAAALQGLNDGHHHRTTPQGGPRLGPAAALIGPIALFLLWDLVVRAGLIKAILLPTPWATVQALVTGLPAARCCWTSAWTVLRTLEPS